MLSDKIRQEMTAAMKAEDKVRLVTLRMLVSEINYKQIDLQRELTDADVVGVIQREVKKRREAIDSYKSGGREEQAKLEMQEMQLLEVYLPKQMSEEEVKSELLKMDLPKDFPGAMKIASGAFKGKAEGAMVARTVKELCQ